MSWIVLELWPDAEHAIVITDENGVNRVFETAQDAQDEADELQDGVILEVN